MIGSERLHSLSRLPAPLLTAYLRTCPDNASVHPPVRTCLAWLRQEAESLASGLSRGESSLFRQQLRRLEEFLHDRSVREKGLVVFAGQDAWETIDLQVEIANELHWGKPAVTQLLWLAAEHKPYCVVVVDRSGARLFDYRLGEVSLREEAKFEVDTSQWKKKDRAHVARPGIRETYGAQRDVFDHRMDAQYRRLSRDVADNVIRLFKLEPFSAVFLAGPERLVTPIAGRFPAELFERAISIHKDLGRVELNGLKEHIEPAIEAWERGHQMKLVEELLGLEKGAVVGIAETLAELQKGAVGRLTICTDLDHRVLRCERCGYTDYSADPVCGVCRGNRSPVRLRTVLPELAAGVKTEIEVVSGEAALKLKQAGGMGGRLRQIKQDRRRRVLVPA